MMLPPDSSIEKHHELDRRAVDEIGSVLRAVMGAVPVVGSALVELVAQLPNLREQRLVDFAKRLESKLSDQSSEAIRLRLGAPGAVDLLEEAIQQAIRASFDARRERLACLVSEGLGVAEQDLEGTHRLLTLLGQVNDSELLLLRGHVPTEAGIRARAEHHALFQSHSVTHGTPESERRLAYVRESYVDHLVALGLLEVEVLGAQDGEGGRLAVPEISSFTNKIRTSAPRITNLGDALLKAVDSYPA